MNILKNKKVIIILTILLVVILLLFIFFIGKDDNKNINLMECTKTGESGDFKYTDTITFDNSEKISNYSDITEIKITKDTSDTDEKLEKLKNLYDFKYYNVENLDYINYEASVNNKVLFIKFEIDCKNYNNNEFNSEIDFSNLSSSNLQKLLENSGYKCLGE